MMTMSNPNLHSPLTRPMGEALASLICAMRRDWDMSGVIVGIRAGTQRGSAIEVIRASIAAAENPANRTPAIIGLPGPHWSAGVSGHVPTSPVERCQVEYHTGLAHNCSQCRAEQIAVQDGHAKPEYDPEGVRRADPEAIRRIRHQMGF